MPDLAPIYKGYRVYPRGFLGANLGEQIKQAERSSASDLLTHNYHPDWFKQPTTQREINRNIEQLWVRLNASHHEIDNIEFRENILRIAKKAFGSDDFLDWVQTQIHGPSTGNLHIDFIRDTMKFIMTGKRQLALHNWLAMLTNMEISTNKTEDDGSLSWFFDNDDGRARNIQLIDVIQRWCSQPGGFADLAFTMHILFGDIAN